MIAGNIHITQKQTQVAEILRERREEWKKV